MTKGKIAYWLATALLCLMYLGGAAAYVMERPMVEQGFVMFGFPTYLITLLIVVKIAGPLAILSRVSVPLSDLAYAGMFYHLILALSAHLNAGDGGFVPAIVGMVLLAISFLTQNMARRVASVNVPARFGAVG